MKYVEDLLSRRENFIDCSFSLFRHKNKSSFVFMTESTN